LHIVGEDTDFFGARTASLVGNHDLDLAADGTEPNAYQTLNSASPPPQWSISP